MESLSQCRINLNKISGALGEGSDLLASVTQGIKRSHVVALYSPDIRFVARIARHSGATFVFSRSNSVNHHESKLPPHVYWYTASTICWPGLAPDLMIFTPKDKPDIFNYPAGNFVSPTIIVPPRGAAYVCADIFSQSIAVGDVLLYNWGTTE